MSKEMQGQDEAYISGYMAGQNSKQPEIDALKMEIIGMRSELVESGMKQLSLMSEIEALKAELQEEQQLHADANKNMCQLLDENEWLRKDAERYRWFRSATRLEAKKLLNNDGSGIMQSTTLDTAIDAAMSALPDTKGE